MGNGSAHIRRVPEKTFRSELVELLLRYGMPAGTTGLLQVHLNNGAVDWHKMELNNPY